MNYDQHDETFEYEMAKLKESLADPDLVCIPTRHIEDMWNQASTLLRELDQLESMGTDIPSLTITALRLRALIFIIPEMLNLETKKEQYNEH